jgi:2-polyprenyl-3-methyl-5-hydroxy-6-metoxy-1,4-benzoquinol methylase
MSQAIRSFGVTDADAYWASRQGAADTAEHELHRQIARLSNEIKPAGGKLLDCGVGDGHVFRLCSEKHDVFGVEISAHAIATCGCPADKIKQTDLNQGIPDFGFTFDIIVVSHVLHWLDRPDLFLDQVHARLTKGGSLLIVIPNITLMSYRLDFLRAKFPPLSLSHRNFQTPAEFETMANQQGWKVDQLITPRKGLRARLWPKLFGKHLIYALSEGERVAAADQAKKFRHA